MNYGEIKKYDIADGPGVRVTLFVSGCRHHCKGCFNAETWDFHYGNPYIAGLTLLGGEPFEPENQRELVKLLKKVREMYPKKNIWSYSGYVYDKDLIPGGRAYTEVTDEMLSYIDVLVDGPFVEDLKDITLQFRGSSNQRILNLREMKL